MAEQNPDSIGNNEQNLVVNVSANIENQEPSGSDLPSASNGTEPAARELLDETIDLNASQVYFIHIKNNFNSFRYRLLYSYFMVFFQMIDILVEQNRDNIENKASPEGIANEPHLGTDENIMANTSNRELDLGTSNSVNEDVIKQTIH